MRNKPDASVLEYLLLYFIEQAYNPSYLDAAHGACMPCDQHVVRDAWHDVVGHLMSLHLTLAAEGCFDDWGPPGHQEAQITAGLIA